MNLLFILAVIVTIMELFVAFFLIKRQKMAIWQSLYVSLPVIVIVWVVAIMYS
ncbi:hypothetical protein [Virgibacillus siamensis]|uniref:hypothetical protein n=1 Tax=Virgibacillus siamensis TaxID=480071 RepID=UPI00158D6714|nr:hypothetical protein [Virgibacillus siamensis]